MTAEPWWKSAVVYQIYPRSFADADGDGIGDLEGLRRRLDHLVDLGVDALWLSPFYPSPMADFGYDVADYCDVDPVFGTLDDFDRLVADAHGRGLKVVVDWVPNHASDKHPWFVESRSARDSPKRDWFVWRDGRDAGPPNNWRRAFTGERTWVRDERGELRSAYNPEPPEVDPTAWTYDEATGQWYLHLFLPEQPDLNWRQPAVVAAMHDVLRFWLDRGVDGFRMDVIHALGKDPDLPDDPPDLAQIPKSATNDDPSTHGIIRDLRQVVDAYPGDRMMVGEVYLLDTARVATYYGDGDELHLAFNFPPLYLRWDARRWRAAIERTEAEVGAHHGWPTWVLSNHDNPRHADRYGTEARARAAAVLLLTLRGTPFLYAGEELGLVDADIPPDRAVDPGGRDGCRAPIPWDASPTHGWPGGEPWLPFPRNADGHDAESQRADPASTWHLYRRLLAARRASPALRLGTWEAVAAPEGVVAHRRVHAGDERVVLVYLEAADVAVPIDGDWTVEVSTDLAHEGRPWAGSLGPDEAVILRPT